MGAFGFRKQAMAVADKVWAMCDNKIASASSDEESYSW